jgi:hypothetical protein
MDATFHRRNDRIRTDPRTDYRGAENQQHGPDNGKHEATGFLPARRRVVGPEGRAGGRRDCGHAVDGENCPAGGALAPVVNGFFGDGELAEWSKATKKSINWTELNRPI